VEEFNIFLGYADDAEEQIKIIEKLKPKIDEYIQNDINKVREKAIYSHCKFFNWKEDASNSIGGQLDKIEPDILASELCLFSFYKRIGETTKIEVELARKNKKYTICLFPDKKKLNNIVEDLEEFEDNEVRNIQLEYKNSLTLNWNDEDSNSITPTQLYNDSSLEDIVFEKIISVIKEFHSLSIPSQKKQKQEEVKNLYFSIPQLPLEYLPRDEDLIEMKSIILDEENSTIAITGVSKALGINGMGGIGKSIFSIALAHDEDVRKYFQDGIYFIKFGQNPNFEDIQKELLTYLYEDIEDITTAVIKRILSDKKVLLILDDIWDINHLKKFNILNSQSKLIITTRQQNIVKGIDAKDYSIDILSPEQSLILLENKIGKINEHLIEIAEKILIRCGYLPLAITIIGSILKGKDIEWWEDVLKDLENAKLENIKFDNLNEPHQNLYKVIHLSVNYLEEKYKKRYLDLSIFFKDKLIPHNTLKVYWGDDYLKTIDTLIMSSLFEMKIKNNETFYILHDLQKDYILSVENDLNSKYKKFMKSYQNFYSNNFSNIPNYDAYFYSNYLNICNNIKDKTISVYICTDILYNKNDISFATIKKLTKFLKLDIKKVAGELLGKSTHTHITMLELKLLKNEKVLIKEFAKQYIKKDINELDAFLINKCLNILGYENVIVKLFASQCIEEYSSCINDIVIVKCLEILGNKNKLAISFAEKIIIKNDYFLSSNIVAKCLGILGKCNGHSISFAKEYFKLSFHEINSSISKECFKLIDNQYEFAIKYAKQYIKIKNKKSFVYEECYNYLKLNNNFIDKKEMNHKHRKVTGYLMGKNKNGISIL